MSISDQQLKEIITKIVTESLKKSSITTDELMDKMDKFKLSPEQMEQVYEALSENKIEIIDSSEKDKDLLLLQLDKEMSMDDPVKVYLKDIGKIPLLSTDEETELAQKMMEGNELAKQRLSEANLRLVVSIAKRYVGR